MSAPHGLLVGVDVGGTFTDLVLLDEATGAVRVAKVPTTPRNQADGVLAAIAAAGGAPADLAIVVHGTTTATNAVLERKGARTGLITTRGFRDVLELGRRTRPTPYGLKGTFDALIPRELRVEVTERVDAEGLVVTPLDEDEVRRAAAWLKARGVEALVIHFIHSYVNAAHERRAREVAAAEWPNAYVTVSADKEMGCGLPVRVPMIDIHTIGAGGGSIARVSSAGILHVGPESAGAEPGPIAYGRGGEEPTITDANLVLGRLNPNALLGVAGGARLDLIREILDKKIGAHLSLDPVAAAAAIVRVANDKMAGAIRLVSLQRGRDPRDFVLFAFGGAGPLHAVALARELAIPKVLVPARPGITSALGCLVADVRHDFVRTINQGLLRMDVAEAHTILAAQIVEGRRLLAGEGVEVETVTVEHAADMQFAGQTHVLTVPIARTDFAREDLAATFERAYLDRFGVELREMRAVVMSLRTAVIGRRRPIALDGLPGTTTPGEPARKRRAWFDKTWRETPNYRREALTAGAILDGPAIVEQLDTTTVIEPGDRARVDALGNLEITVRGA